MPLLVALIRCSKRLQHCHSFRGCCLSDRWNIARGFHHCPVFSLHSGSVQFAPQLQEAAPTIPAAMGRFYVRVAGKEVLPWTLVSSLTEGNAN